MTVQDQIDAYVANLLAGILAVNGYQTDAGASVYRELEYTGHPDAMPSVAWFSGELQSGEGVGPVPAEMGEVNHLYPLSWEGFISDTLDGAEGRKLRADLIKALYADRTFGGLIESIEGCRSSVATDGGEEIFSITQVSFTAFYVTPFGEE